MKTFGLASSVLAVVLAATLLAQVPAAPMMIASVKPSKSVDEAMGARSLPGGAFEAHNSTVTYLLNFAYGVSENTIVGGPDWIKRERWDVDAKWDRVADGQPIPRTSELVRTILRDRFKLDAVMEKRDRPVYALRLVRDEQTGPNLTRSAFTCGDPASSRKARESGVRGVRGEPACSIDNRGGSVRFAGMPFTTLVAFIPAERPVIDQARLTGTFDVTLEWNYARDPVADNAALMTALRDQLGLRLQPTTAPLDVLVITSITRPTAN